LLERPQGGGEDDRAFRKLGVVVDEEVAALREQLRNDLSRELKITIDGSNSYFGVQKALTSQGTLRLRLPSLDGGDNTTVVFSARARVSVDIQIKTVSVSATLVLAVDAAATSNATFFWETPSWPAFNLPLPQFDFSTFSFLNLKKLLPDKWPSFALPPLPFAEKVSFKWTKQPNVQISVDAQGAITLQTDIADGSGDLWFGDPDQGGSMKIALLTGFGITMAANKITVAGSVTLSNSWTLQDYAISEGPFDITLKGITLSSTLTTSISEPQTDLQITISAGQIRIQAKKDPNLFLVLTAVIVVNIGDKKGSDHDPNTEGH
jgi:hypothetical protein